MLTFQISLLVGFGYLLLAAALPVLFAMLSLALVAAASHAFATLAFWWTNGRFGRDDTLEGFVGTALEVSGAKPFALSVVEKRATTPLFGVSLGITVLVVVACVNAVLAGWVDSYLYLHETAELPW
jgi:hypothetical protein|eukprot:2326485-Prymnesium_polylepis.2